MQSIHRPAAVVQAIQNCPAPGVCAGVNGDAPAGGLAVPAQPVLSSAPEHRNPKAAGVFNKPENNSLAVTSLARIAQLEAKIRQLESFSYSAAHDLRAPLRGISSWLEILVTEQGDTVSGEAHRIIGIIQRSAARMHRMVDDILRFARADHKALEKSEVDMAGVARTAFDQQRETTLGTGPMFVLGDIPAAEGDSAMLKQVFINLFDNAFKFSRGRANSTLHVTGSSRNGMNTYCVTDNGVGFKQCRAEQLFAPFTRAHRQDEFEGTGLGLSLVRTIVERHGGTTWAEGEPNAGAKIFFTLPQGARP